MSPELLEFKASTPFFILKQLSLRGLWTTIQPRWSVARTLDSTNRTSAR